MEAFPIQCQRVSVTDESRDVDPFGFLSEGKLGTHLERAGGSTVAEHVIGGSSRPVPEPEIDDEAFPSEASEPPPMLCRDATRPAPDTDFPAESPSVVSTISPGASDKRHGRAPERDGRLLLLLSAFALGAAAFVVTQQALTRARPAAPSGTAVPAPVLEEPTSLPRVPQPPTLPPTTGRTPSAAPLDGTAGMLPTRQPAPAQVPQSDPTAAPPGDNTGSKLLTDARPEPPAALLRGSLAVNSSPPGAQVFVNGVAVGETPLVLDSVSIGSRVVRIELEGYERWSSVVRIVAGQNATATALLRPLAVP
jgi:hypothetical protein